MSHQRHAQSIIPSKRKLSVEADEQSSSGRSSPTDDPEHIIGEYETGHVLCEVCDTNVSFRDENTGDFTVKHWEAHRQTCGSTSSAAPLTEPVVHTPETTAESFVSPPAKRRRAKRTEEERIDYLRLDPYVEKFEPYRVLCGSCDKWIRLRPNSTYCSIPWDAHRKSCLSRKSTNKDAGTLNSILSKDPYARKFDAERVLCNVCDKWIAIDPESHSGAIGKWHSHRSVCHTSRTSATTHEKSTTLLHAAARDGIATSSSRDSNIVSVDLSLHRQSPSFATLRPVINTDKLDTQSGNGASPPIPLPTPTSQQPGSPSSSREFSTLTSHSSHESRRRNAEQRAATLRADPLIGEVEPGRVFCSLCQKWVQLRQDSSYCAYPWLQHRGKCLQRHQRRIEKSADMQDINVWEKEGLMTPREYLGERDELEDDNACEERVQGREPIRDRRLQDYGRPRPLTSSSARVHLMDEAATVRSRRDPSSIPRDESSTTKHRQRSQSLSLADFGSSAGRRRFVFASVHYLFNTTYEGTDEMTISALLTYLNAALPPDKHEEFDTAEVVRAAAALQERREIVFEGDTIRLPD